MTITKKHLASSVADKLGITTELAYEAVNILFDAMREALMEGNRIEVRGFGVLGVKNTKPKPAARNPRTGELTPVPARKKTYFRAGAAIKKVLHKPSAEEGKKEKHS